LAVICSYYFHSNSVIGSYSFYKRDMIYRMSLIRGPCRPALRTKGEIQWHREKLFAYVLVSHKISESSPRICQEVADKQYELDVSR
jgi:hypothetical protein